MDEATAERILDARIMARLSTDRAYRNAESAEEADDREREIELQEIERLDDEVAAAVYGQQRFAPCVHGHFDCATVERGECANETFARIFGKITLRGGR